MAGAWLAGVDAMIISSLESLCDVKLTWLVGSRQLLSDIMIKCRCVIRVTVPMTCEG